MPGANGPDQQFITFGPEREDDENAPPLIRSPYGPEAALLLRMGRIGENGKRTGEKAFNDESRSPCFSHLARLPLSQSKPLARKVHESGKDRQLYRQMSSATLLQLPSRIHLPHALDCLSAQAVHLLVQIHRHANMIRNHPHVLANPKLTACIG